MPGQYAKYPATTGGGGGGTVVSVGLALPTSVFTITGSPVTTSGTLTGSFVPQPANTVFAGPTSGGPGTPTFRPLVVGDIPTLPYALDSFTIMQTPLGTSPTASSATDTLTWANTDGHISITGNSGTKTITLNTSGLQPTGNYITALTGDVTATGPGSVAATLATVNSNVGTFLYPQITVNAKGLVTAASTPTQSANTVFAGPTSGGSAVPAFRTLVEADLPVSSGFQFITSGTTYTTPANTTTNTLFKFTLIGAGGGGGGMNTTNGKGSGGGAGAVGILWATGISPGTALTIAIGAAGVGGVSTTTPATNGGNTTITISAAIHTCSGGKGGASTVSSAGGTGGTNTGSFTISLGGQAGGPSTSAGASNPSGIGGNCIFGQGGQFIYAAGTGGNANGYGAGGSGGSGLAANGGNGAPGAIIVEWSV